MKLRYGGWVLVGCVLLHSAVICHAAVINLPEDYPSIQEAVENAASGDVIQVNQHNSYFIKEQFVPSASDLKGVRIVNKDLKIIGTIPNEKVKIVTNPKATTFLDIKTGNEISPDSQYNLLVIENSNVIIENLDMNDFQKLSYGPNGDTSAPIQVVSGKLTLNNVEIRGLLKVFSHLEMFNTVFKGYSGYVGNAYSLQPIPAIHIRNKSNANLRIVNSEILCVYQNGRFLASYGSRPLVIENIKESSIQIIDSIIIAGGHSYGIPRQENVESYWNYPDPFKGLSGILIADCFKLTINIYQSEIYGGASNNYGNSLQNDNLLSGPGLEFINSENITIQNGQLIGKDGKKGFIHPLNNNIYHSSDGGNALHITNSSVILENVELIPGKGGTSDPELDILPGEDGVPIYQDENSTVRFATLIPDWDLY